MSTLRGCPNLSTLCSSRRSDIDNIRRERRLQLQQPRVIENIYETLERSIIQSTTLEDTLNVLKNSSDVIRSAIRDLNNTDTETQHTSLRLFQTIANLQNNDALNVIMSAFPFVTFLVRSNDIQNSILSSRIISTICQTAPVLKRNFLNLGVLEDLMRQCEVQMSNIMASTVYIQTLSVFMQDDLGVVGTVLNSVLPRLLMEQLAKTNNTQFISSTLLFFSFLSSNALFAQACLQTPSFIQFLAVMLTTSASVNIISPTLTIVGNFFTISTHSQLTPLLTPLVIDSLIRLLQSGLGLEVDIIWVLGNLVSVTDFSVVSRLVSCGCIPLLFKTLENSENKNEDVVISVLVALSNIMMCEYEKKRPFVQCCVELGIIDYIFDFLKVMKSDRFVEVACDILNFLNDNVSDFPLRVQNIGGIDVLKDLSYIYSVSVIIKKLNWVLYQ
ncbi:hypothetical protein EIN_372130 [Entamoeba invadens IP1]|uniref:Importin subunit alpha-1 n=1 Tax=Entamoeba invadens IP1 TaxID=370355 RepID=A0A0A1UC25_ENTIV|nr:hypothetical protein EIN_372130 [Entamoeba invadens IP1]ELP92791.1 hypothetical protein EIN_372130 [Entamoeba invadens IP1]|eukprot:XP_004259562.1 hypothetical protein EIN_372130 [Entamoeba invadens IP1]